MKTGFKYVLPVLVAGLLLISKVYLKPSPALEISKGYAISAYATGLGNARLMVRAENGDIILSGYNDGTVMLVKADGDGDGRSDGITRLITGANNPHGLVLSGGRLYVAESHRVSSYHFNGRKLTDRKTVLDGIPDGHHASRTIKQGADGWIYLSVGSSCNVCIETHPWRAAIVRFRPGYGRVEIVARGLRNSVGFDWQPGTGNMYAVNAGRDLLGDDVPREELNRIEKGRHYGWPFAYENNVPDPQFGKLKPPGLEMTAPVHTFTAHSTPLSIRFLRYQKGIRPGSVALVARHGSWNRSTKSGYDVLWLEWLADGSIRQTPFITGFVRNGKILGRPVDILEAPGGTIFLSDDRSGTIWRIVRTGK